MSNLAFQISGDDLQLLDQEDFDLVWSALGLIIRARYPWVGTVVASPVAFTEPKDPEAGVPATDADELGPTATGPAAEQVATPPGPPPEPKNRPAAKAPPVDGEPRRQPKTCADCGRVIAGGAGLAAHRKAAHGVQAVAAVRADVPVAAAAAVVLGDAPVDFTDRARKAASRTWDERVNGAEA